MNDLEQEPTGKKKRPRAGKAGRGRKRGGGHLAPAPLGKENSRKKRRGGRGRSRS